MKRVLIGCEFSQKVTKAFRDKGFEAHSCDIRPAEINPDWHYQGDVFDIVDQDWDLAIFHPPCTYLNNASYRWLFEGGSRKAGLGLNIERWMNLLHGITFFQKLRKVKIPHIAVENPVMNKPSLSIAGPASQFIQPYEFGDPESKRTGLWLKNLPLLVPTDKIEPEWVTDKDGNPYKDSNGYKYTQNAYSPQWKNRTPSGQNNLSPSPDRGKLRSITYPGIAAAMADQWGNFILNH